MSSRIKLHEKNPHVEILAKQLLKENPNMKTGKSVDNSWKKVFSDIGNDGKLSSEEKKEKQKRVRNSAMKKNAVVNRAKTLKRNEKREGSNY